jgi:hypothetical protein
MPITADTLRRARKVLDAADVAPGPRILRCTGAQFNALRASVGAASVAVAAGDYLEVDDHGWTVLRPASDYDGETVIGCGEIGDLR